MDCIDLAEKAVKKKAAAAEVEQPEKEVNHGKWWYGPNYTKAKLKIKLSGNASILADYIYSHYIEGKDWDFKNWHARQETDLSLDLMQDAKTELVDKNVVKREIVRNDKGRFGSWRYPFNPDFETWKTITGKTVKGKTINGKSINGKPINGKSTKGKTIKGKNGNINIEEDKVLSKSNHDEDRALSKSDYGRDLNMEEREGAAAKPQPAPALSEGAENVPEESAAQNSPGAASQESSFPETAQGQQNGNKYQIPLTVPEVMEQGPRDLWGEPERVPEKPKKKPKGKGKAAEEIEIPEVEEIKIYIAGYIQENYEKGVHSYIWTDWELTETAGDIQRAIPKYKWKDWKQGARNWIRNNRDGAFKPKMRDPARDTRNKPGRARGQVTTAARIMEMAGNTDPQRALEQRREQEIQKGGVIIQN